MSEQAILTRPQLTQCILDLNDGWEDCDSQNDYIRVKRKTDLLGVSGPGWQPIWTHITVTNGSVFVGARVEYGGDLYTVLDQCRIDDHTKRVLDLIWESR